jgi:hypothetical protein
MIVQKDEDLPMSGLRVYLFNTVGIYLGRSATTDASGQVEFSVPEESYMVRVDYLGYQFWSEEVLIVEDTVMEMPIRHQQVEITAQGSFQGIPMPIDGIKIYLFSPTGTYLGQSKFTDSFGKTTFDLPHKNYKVRADYLGQQFWSEDFLSQDAMVTIQQGSAKIHTQRSGTDLAGAKIYLFNETGSYLEWNEITNLTGIAEFVLPDRAFKFRIDENGEQHWTPLIQIHAGAESLVDFDFDH